MKHKTKYVLILLLFSSTILSLPQNVKGFYWFLEYMETNKNTYCIDEQVHINASWTLTYNPANEISYIQIQIFNSYDDKIWNTSEYTEIGSIEKNWTIEIQELDLDFSNYTNTLYIKCFSFYFQIDTASSNLTRGLD